MTQLLAMPSFARDLLTKLQNAPTITFALGLLSLPFLAVAMARFVRRQGQFWLKMTATVIGLGLACLGGIPVALYCRVTGNAAVSNYYVARLYYHVARPFLRVRCKLVGDLDALYRQNATTPSCGPSPAPSRSTTSTNSESSSSSSSTTTTAHASSAGQSLYEGPFVAICNHQSSLDLYCMAFMWPKRLQVVIKESMRWYPLLGPYVRLARAVAIRRTDRTRAIEALRQAGNEIHQRQISVLLFPEGTRSRLKEPGLLPFKKGAFHMAIEAQVPIVPIVFSNMQPLYSFEERRFKDGTITIKVLPPVDTRGYTAETVDQLIDKCHAQMLQALHEIETIPDEYDGSSQSRKDR